MPDIAPAIGDAELQFDRLVTQPGVSPPAGTLAVICSVCQASIETEYYDANGSTVCGSCRAAVEAAAEPPRGMAPLAAAGVFGLGAGIVGSIIYYAVIAFANLEIGIIAILIGYMVGYAVRKGAGGRGGLRFQVLAVVLTYASVALAYSPLAFKGAAESTRQANAPGVEQPANTPTTLTGPAQTTPATLSAGGLLVALATLAALILALPVLVVAGSFPSGLISALIIFFGMRQAWVMTGAHSLQVFGPYRVGDGPPAASA